MAFQKYLLVFTLILTYANGFPSCQTDSQMSCDDNSATKCVSIESVCDDVIDCSDQSDENPRICQALSKFESNSECRPKHIFCQWNSRCISIDQFCSLCQNIVKEEEKMFCELIPGGKLQSGYQSDGPVNEWWSVINLKLLPFGYEISWYSDELVKLLSMKLNLKGETIFDVSLDPRTHSIAIYGLDSDKSYDIILRGSFESSGSKSQLIEKEMEVHLEVPRFREDQSLSPWQFVGWDYNGRGELHWDIKPEDVKYSTSKLFDLQMNEKIEGFNPDLISGEHKLNNLKAASRYLFLIDTSKRRYGPSGSLEHTDTTSMLLFNTLDIIANVSVFEEIIDDKPTQHASVSFSPKPFGQLLSGYIIEMTGNSDDETCETNVIALPRVAINGYKYTFYHLNPSTSYKIRFSPIQDTQAKWFTQEFTTFDEEPSSVRNLTVQEFPNHVFKIKMKKPKHPNGLITKYWLEIESQLPTDDSHFIYSVPGNTTEIYLQNKEMKQKIFLFNVWAENRNTNGSKEQVIHQAGQ